MRLGTFHRQIMLRFETKRSSIKLAAAEERSVLLLAHQLSSAANSFSISCQRVLAVRHLERDYFVYHNFLPCISNLKDLCVLNFKLCSCGSFFRAQRRYERRRMKMKKTSIGKLDEEGFLRIGFMFQSAR